MKWEQYETEGSDYIPVSEWGSDHWSTFAYLETLTVDHGGIINNDKMRCEPRLHREFATRHHFMMGGEYPTRLRDGERSKHDDWSCLEDMVAAGLIDAWSGRINSNMSNNTKAKVTFTAKGREIANALRAHKAAGGQWRDFTPQLLQEPTPQEQSA